MATRGIFLSVLQIDFRYDGSTSIVTSRSIRVESSWFDKICNSLSWPLAEYFLSVLQIDFWYDGSTLTETSRSIRQHFQQPLTVTYEIFCLVDDYQISGITRRINREWTSGRTILKLRLTNRGGLGVLDNSYAFATFG